MPVDNSRRSVKISFVSWGQRDASETKFRREARLSKRLKPVDGRLDDKIGELAQLGERNVRNVEVVGSTPILSTLKARKRNFSSFFISWRFFKAGSGGGATTALALRSLAEFGKKGGGIKFLTPRNSANAGRRFIGGVRKKTFFSRRRRTRGKLGGWERFLKRVARVPLAGAPSKRRPDSGVGKVETAFGIRLSRRRRSCRRNAASRKIGVCVFLNFFFALVDLFFDLASPIMVI